MSHHVKHIFSLLLALAVFPVFCQDNLVKNGGIEDPWVQANILSSDGRTTFVKEWFIPTYRAPEYFYDSHVSTILPAEGKGVIGMVGFRKKLGFKTKGRSEFAGAELKEPLEEGKTYCVCYQEALHRTSKWAVQNFGLKFFNERPTLTQKQFRKLNPDILTDGDGYTTNMKWLKHCAYYKAKGGERFLVFGFYGKSKPKKLKKLDVARLDDWDVFANKAYYMLDDVSVSESQQCGCTNAIEETWPKKKVTFIVDMSSSMKQDGVFDSLRTKLFEWKHTLHDSDEVSLVAFSSSVRTLYQGPSSLLTREMISDFLSYDNLSGGTNIGSGLKEGYKLHLEDLQKYEKSEIVLISDGRFQLNLTLRGMIEENYNSSGLILNFIHIENEIKGKNHKTPGLRYTSVSRKDFSTKVTDFYSKAQVTRYCDPIPEPTKILPRDYTFILDYSGSMSGKYEEYERELVKSILNVPDSARISVVSFSESSKVLYQGLRVDLSGEVFRSIFRHSYITGGTSVKSGMNQGYKLAVKKSDTSAIARVIVFSDVGKTKVNLAYRELDTLKGNNARDETELSFIQIKSVHSAPRYFEYDNYTSLFTRTRIEELFDIDSISERGDPKGYLFQPYSNPVQKPRTNKKLRGILRTFIYLSIIAGIIYISVVSDDGDGN